MLQNITTVDFQEKIRASGITGHNDSPENIKRFGELCWEQGVTLSFELP